ncbi:MAG: hypothetical protein F9K23_04725 [Bacteroidetes bacterium]|nr:MAG: hypothetical protein F9K23_04725 [Bacteroidota bacterium]
MHTLEPFFLWRELYRAEDDNRSPFYEREYSEFEFTHQIYNHLIHPQWDEFGSPTLYIKIIYADYETGFAVIEMIGEWNDAINNDIMFLKREVLELLMQEGIDKFIMIGENVLNFHSSDDSYYEEWFSDVENGWVAFINFREHVLDEFKSANIDYYVNFGGEMDDMNWRKFSPYQLYDSVDTMLKHRLA